jgi:hypothetical protein
MRPFRIDSCSASKDRLTVNFIAVPPFLDRPDWLNGEEGQPGRQTTSDVVARSKARPVFLIRILTHQKKPVKPLLKFIFSGYNM